MLRIPGWSQAAAPYFLLCFLAGLTTLVITGDEELRRRRQDSGRVADPAARSLAVVAGFLLVAALLAWLLAGSRLTALGRPLGVLLGPPAEAAERLGHGAADRVRRLYRRLQRAGAAAGRARSAVQTPQEYQETLAGSSLPDQAVATITELYQAVRYGDVVPDAGALAAAEGAGEALQRD